MRISVAAALAALWIQPAQAAVVLNLAAEIPITTVTDYGTDFSYSGCVNYGGHCVVTTGGIQSITDAYVFAPDGLSAGEDFFFNGGLPGGALLYGSATYLSPGTYAPQSVTYSIGGPFSLTYSYGTTSQFTLTDPRLPAVPEAETWAMLLLGLFAMAAWLRRDALPGELHPAAD